MHELQLSFVGTHCMHFTKGAIQFPLTSMGVGLGPTLAFKGKDFAQEIYWRWPFSHSANLMCDREQDTTLHYEEISNR